MLQHTKSQSGFTLLELIIAVGIIGALSLVSVQNLWDTLSTRSKQYSIENSASAVRPILATLEQAITSASSSSIISSSEIRITGSTCSTIKLVGPAIVQQTVASPPCMPPTSGTFSPLTPSNVTISQFSFTPTSGMNPPVISITIGGTYTDSLGSHIFYATTSAVPRVSI